MTVSPIFDLDEVESTLRRHGAAVLPRWLSERALDDLRPEFAGLFEVEDPRIFHVPYGRGQGLSLERDASYMAAFPLVTTVFADPKMEALALRYVRKPLAFNYEIYATHDTEGGGLIAPTHFDKLWTLKFMLYLDDMTPGGGAFGVIPGSTSHSRRIFREFMLSNGLTWLDTQDPLYSEMPNHAVPSSLQQVVDIIGPAGTLIVFETDVFHRAAHLERGRQRRILRGHSGPARSYRRVRRLGRQWWRAERPPLWLRPCMRILG